ncbi:MAG: LysR family transcriptional regulator [Pikeienuella sp.]|uniref:LysR family transcriptional regulator n=1 Tax=Pikeienuella sp. TaxID=2831957 RepID=UPI00391CFB03
MELNDIRYFLASCETLNFTRAAELCGVSTPTVTRSIQKLEEKFGGQLFRRERRLTHLTDLGRLVQRHLADAQKATDEALAEAGRYAATETRLRLGVIATMPAAHLVAFLTHLRQKAPELDIDIWESHCAELGAALEAGEIDVALMSLPDYPETMRPAPLFREPYFVAFAPGHRFEAMNAVPMREFEGEDYVKRLHCEFPSNFVKLGLAKPYGAVRVRYATEREDWVQSMVAAGLGMTLMPEYLPVLPGIVLRPIVEPEVHRTISIVTRAGRRHSPPVAKALEAARTMAWPQSARPTAHSA